MFVPPFKSTQLHTFTQFFFVSVAVTSAVYISTVFVLCPRGTVAMPNVVYSGSVIILLKMWIIKCLGLLYNLSINVIMLNLLKSISHSYCCILYVFIIVREDVKTTKIPSASTVPAIHFRAFE